MEGNSKGLQRVSNDGTEEEDGAEMGVKICFREEMTLKLKFDQCWNFIMEG